MPGAFVIYCCGNDVTKSGNSPHNFFSAAQISNSLRLVGREMTKLLPPAISKAETFKPIPKETPSLLFVICIIEG
jgi:hypothetical protein